MALPSPGKCYVLLPLLILLAAGLLYTGCAFRIRDHAPEICHPSTKKCGSSGTSTSPYHGTSSTKRGFETVSTRGSFAKSSKVRPPDEEKEDADDDDHTLGKWKEKKTTLHLWSKLNKIEDARDDEEDDDEVTSIDSDDEIVKIEVEDDDDAVVVDSEEEDRKVKEKLRQEEEEKRKREKEAEERRRREKLEQEKRRKEEEERKRKAEEERKKKEKELEEKRQKEEMERRLKEEAERRLREETERRLREEEERKLREEEERRQKEEEEKRKEHERRLKEEEERRRKEAEEKRKREEEERRKKEAEEKRKREEEERRLREAEEARRLKEEEEKQRQEEQRIKELEEKRKRYEEEEAERKRKEDEERKKKELEEKEAERKRKEDEERKKKQREESEAERKRDEEEDKKRVERVKREAEEKKLRDAEERRKRSKLKKNDNDDDDDDEDDEDDSSPITQRKLEKVRLVDKENAKKSEPTKAKTPKSGSGGKATKSKKTKSTPKATKPDATMSLAELNDMILSVPTFVPNFTAVEDPACQQHGKIFLRQLRGYKLWALQMLDSSAKIPSGLLRGNVNQLGDFDQCLGVSARVKVDEKTIKVQGKYCLANMDLYPTQSGTKVPVNLMQSRSLIRGNMRDPGHFIPRFTTVNWAVCLPAACSAVDARRSIESALDNYNMSIGIRFVVDVDSDMCYVSQKSQSYSKETIGVLYFYAIFICLAIVATFRDYYATLQGKGNYSERIIMAFSLKRTVKALFGNKDTDSSDIGCIHGIRSLSTIALYVAHKLIPTSRIPYANRVSLTESASNPVSSMLRASLFYTDSFLLLSGVLTAYNMAKELTKRNEIRWFCRFIARFVRLTPSLLAVVFWYAFVMEHTGSGPQWNAVVKANADICKENAWINLLYVQNFFPFEEMCATHTHQLALDMQLSLAAPALVFFLQIKPIVGIIIVFFLLQVSATLRYLATSNNNLSLVIFHGMTMKHLYKTANMTYTLPLHRATPYLFGISLGVILHYVGKNMRINKFLVIIGWLIAIAFGSWSLFSPWRLARRDYTYDVDDATHYAVISPVLTALALSWTIFACFTNNGGFITKLLSNYWMIVFSKLSYAIYLTQFVVFFYNVGTTRYSTEFQPYRIIDPYEVITVVSASIVLTLLFDIPMQEVKSIIMECSDSTPIEETEDVSTPEESHKDVNKINQEITPEDEEDFSPGGWNWNHGTFTKATRSEPREYDENGLDESHRSSRLKRNDARRQTMIRSEYYDDWDDRSSRRTSRSEEHSIDDGRRNRSDYRLSNYGLDDDQPENYLHPRDRYFSNGYSRSPMRDVDTLVHRRSASRERPLSKESEIPARDYSNKPKITISKEEDYQPSRSPRASMSRFTEQQRSLSSESDMDYLGSRRSSGNFNRSSSAEPRISDQSDWEEELRIRRNRYLQGRVSSQERDRPLPVAEEEVDEWNSLKRRSSAEGKIALLKEPFRPGNMELWTVSKLQLGSSQEPDDEDMDDMYLHHRREYREQGPPLREEFEEEADMNGRRRRSFASESLPTSFEEEDDGSYEFGLNKDRKMITVQDLSKLSMEDEQPAGDNNWNKLDVKSNAAGLFKRESIVKSQASEEDPEYLLPERPKLVEQEQEHPLKKAWQMQKSRSEEEGPSGFAVKEAKVSTVSALEKQKEESEEKNDDEVDHEGPQSEATPEAEVTCDVTIVWQSRSNEVEDKSSSKSEESSRSSKLDLQSEEDQYDTHRSRTKSDEENWTWSERDT